MQKTRRYLKRHGLKPESPRFKNIISNDAVNINLRIPMDLFTDIEKVRNQKYQQNRTSWILDALEDKLRK